MSKIKIIPFGGVRENGKNMYAVEVDGQIFILDCGLKYPENELMVSTWSFRTGRTYKTTLTKLRGSF